jgi:hypothetical protein
MLFYVKKNIRPAERLPESRGILLAHDIVPWHSRAVTVDEFPVSRGSVTRLPRVMAFEPSIRGKQHFRKKDLRIAGRYPGACVYRLSVALAASKAAGYMSLQRPWDAEIVTVGQKRARRIAK